MTGQGRLNIGCGHDTRAGWINLDRVHLDGVDLVHDLTQCPWPFEDESFVEILAKDVLEHVHNLTEVVTESHRVLKPGGTLTIQVPHFTSKDAFSDPTHVRPFSSLSFDYFTATHSRNYYSESNFSSVVERTILFDLTKVVVGVALFSTAGLTKVVVARVGATFVGLSS